MATKIDQEEYIDFLVKIPPQSVNTSPSLTYIRSPMEYFNITEAKSIRLLDKAKASGKIEQKFTVGPKKTWMQWGSQSAWNTFGDEIYVQWIRSEL